MVRKFECKQCKTKFEADDRNSVTCPHCHSDNVDYAHFRIPTRVWMGIGCVVLLVGLVWGLSKMDNPQQDIEQEEPVNNNNEEDSIRNTYVETTGLSLPPEIIVESPVFDGENYSIEAKVKNIQIDKLYFAILDFRNSKKVISKNETGKFKDVPYSEAEGGTYFVAVFDAVADTLICKIDKPGFIKQKAVSTRMTVAELQKKMHARDNSLLGVGENDYLSPDYTLKFVGLPQNAINKPKILYEVFEKLDNEVWESATVVSLEYDDMNRISTITLNVKESDFNF